MSDCITDFFDAWQIKGDERRLAQITSCVTDTIQYDDPRTTETLKGITALNSYLGMFSANAPTWSAKVVKCDTIAEVTRVTVSFSGTGADGALQVQLGQYFVQKQADKIARMVGFVGTGD